jgi:hypothetical protein
MADRTARIWPGLAKRPADNVRGRATRCSEGRRPGRRDLPGRRSARITACPPVTASHAGSPPYRARRPGRFECVPGCGGLVLVAVRSVADQASKRSQVT